MHFPLSALSQSDLVLIYVLAFVLQVSVDGNVSTLIGRKGPGKKDGRVQDARVSRPEGIFVTPLRRNERTGVIYGGNVIIADTGNGCIRALSQKLNYIITLAGMPGFMGHQDGNQEDANMDDLKEPVSKNPCSTAIFTMIRAFL